MHCTQGCYLTATTMEAVHMPDAGLLAPSWPVLLSIAAVAATRVRLAEDLGTAHAAGASRRPDDMLFLDNGPLMAPSHAGAMFAALPADPAMAVTDGGLVADSVEGPEFGPAVMRAAAKSSLRIPPRSSAVPAPHGCGMDLQAERPAWPSRMGGSRATAARHSCAAA